MASIRVAWLLVFILSSLFITISEARHGKKLPSAAVVGTVYCEACFQQDLSRSSHFISGASVAVKCGNEKSEESFYKEVKTNEYGVFEVHLPTAVSKHFRKIKGCSVKLIHSSEPFCAVASTATSSALHPKGRKEGTHIFSTGVFTFKPLKQPEFCNQKPVVPTSKEFNHNKALSLSLGLTMPALPALPANPALPAYPAIPTLPLPDIPLLPPLPPLPALPKLLPMPTLGQQPSIPVQPKATKDSKTNPLSDKKTFQPSFLFPPIIPPVLPTPAPTIGGIPLPPNPLQPAPLLPNPLQPPPASGIPGLPPLFPTPPASSIPGLPPLLPTPLLPPIPILSPPPPPPPTLLPPLPQLPPFPAFPLPPGFPGIPPASSAKKTSP